MLSHVEIREHAYLASTAASRETLKRIGLNDNNTVRELGDLQEHPSVSIIEAPMMEISSSAIRKLISEKKSIRYWVPDKVLEEIERSSMYS